MNLHKYEPSEKECLLIITRRPKTIYTKRPLNAPLCTQSEYKHKIDLNYWPIWAHSLCNVDYRRIWFNQNYASCAVSKNIAFLIVCFIIWIFDFIPHFLDNTKEHDLQTQHKCIPLCVMFISGVGASSWLDVHSVEPVAERRSHVWGGKGEGASCPRETKWYRR